MKRLCPASTDIVLNADVDVDGKPTSADAMAILKYTIGLITELPLKAE